MFPCATCGKRILIFSISDGEAQFCGKGCLNVHREVMARMRAVPEEEATHRAAEMRIAACPSCGSRNEPLDVQTAVEVVSYFIGTRATSRSLIACKRCGDRMRWRAVAKTTALGPWSLSGLFSTPLVLLRNLIWIARRPMAFGPPSPELKQAARRLLVQSEKQSSVRESSS
jgi:DNA-directed RNA polymerase subunit RPC12/RpoP